MSQPSSPSAPVGSAPPKPPPPVVRPAPESRLEQLTARYDEAKKAEKEKKAEAAEITDAIKAELTRLHPGVPEMLLHSPYLSAPLQLQNVSTVRFDVKSCKEQNPIIYSAYAKFSTQWVLKRIAS